MIPRHMYLRDCIVSDAAAPAGDPMSSWLQPQPILSRTRACIRSLRTKLSCADLLYLQDLDDSQTAIAWPAIERASPLLADSLGQRGQIRIATVRSAPLPAHRPCSAQVCMYVASEHFKACYRFVTVRASVRFVSLLPFCSFAEARPCLDRNQHATLQYA